jgi:hypothetical protein
MTKRKSGSKRGASVSPEVRNQKPDRNPETTGNASVSATATQQVDEPTVNLNHGALTTAVLYLSTRSHRHTFAVWKKDDGSTQTAFYPQVISNQPPTVATESETFAPGAAQLIAAGFRLVGYAASDDGKNWAYGDIVGTGPVVLGSKGLTTQLLEQALDELALAEAVASSGPVN